MKNILRRVTVCTALILSVSILTSAATKGHLVIIGGGERPDNVMQTFYGFAGGIDAKYLVISNANKSHGEDFLAALNAAGIRNAEMIIPSREEADDEAYVAGHLNGVTGIFISGGLQTKIAKDIRGTLLHKRLMEMYEDGAVIGGTSAGAAIMTDPMLIATHVKEPNQKSDDKGVRCIKANYMKVTGGLGFLKGAILDQHFLKRQRQNRMLCVALDHPDLVTMGIDEATALIVSNGNEIEVMGEGSVTVAKPVKETIKTNKNGYYAAKIDFSLLVEGDRIVL